MSPRPSAALRGALLVALASLALPPSARAGEGEGADLPIRKVVLYKHGIGYFERGGKVDGDALATLRFSSSQMNDVLKSLTVLDLDYHEDASAHVDMNVVMTGGGRFVELQGTAEGATFGDDQLRALLRLARSGIRRITAHHRRLLAGSGLVPDA